MPRLAVSAVAETWPIAGSFGIARGTKTAAEVVVATVSDGSLSGRGECVPYARYGEQVEQTVREVETFARETAGGFDRESLRAGMPPGAARNALDCALWDLEARRTGQPVHVLAGLAEPRPVVTAFTLGLADVQTMAAQAATHAGRGLLKIKLGGTDRANDLARLEAIRTAAPATRLIVDANEGWDFAFLAQIAPRAAELGVELIEQPLPDDADEALEGWRSPVPIGADESIHATSGLEALAARYQVVNVKLDKTGGLTEAIGVVARARELGLGVMVGCMVATSLSMAPALMLAALADFVDLDGPLLLTRDRDDGLVYDGDLVGMPEHALWGGS